MPKSTYDLVAVGTRTAAKMVALACRCAGWRVAVMDHLPFGGTCALRGCDPKKALWSMPHAYDIARRLGTAGLRGTGGLSLDWSEMAAFKRSFTDPVPAKRGALFYEEGMPETDALGTVGQTPTRIDNSSAGRAERLARRAPG